MTLTLANANFQRCDLRKTQIKLHRQRQTEETGAEQADVNHLLVSGDQVGASQSPGQVQKNGVRLAAASRPCSAPDDCVSSLKARSEAPGRHVSAPNSAARAHINLQEDEASGLSRRVGSGDRAKVLRGTIQQMNTTDPRGDKVFLA